MILLFDRKPILILATATMFDVKLQDPLFNVLICTVLLDLVRQKIKMIIESLKRTKHVDTKTCI